MRAALPIHILGVPVIINSPNSIMLYIKELTQKF